MILLQSLRRSLSKRKKRTIVSHHHRIITTSSLIRQEASQEPSQEQKRPGGEIPDFMKVPQDRMNPREEAMDKIRAGFYRSKPDDEKWQEFCDLNSRAMNLRQIEQAEYERALLYDAERPPNWDPNEHPEWLKEHRERREKQGKCVPWDGPDPYGILQHLYKPYGPDQRTWIWRPEQWLEKIKMVAQDNYLEEHLKEPEFNEELSWLAGVFKPRFEGDRFGGYPYSISQTFVRQLMVYEHKDLLRQYSPTRVTLSYEEIWRHASAFGTSVEHTVVDETGASVASVLPFNAENLICFLGTLRAKRPYYFLPFSDWSADGKNFLRQVGLTSPAILLFPPRVGNVVQVDEIYRILPGLRTTEYYEKFLHRGFAYLRAILHTGNRSIMGMSALRAFMCYNPTPNPLPTWKDIMGNDSNRCNTLSFLEVSKKFLPKDSVPELRTYASTPFSEFSIMSCAELMSRELELGEKDIICCTIPFFFTCGFAFSLPLALICGGQMCIPNDHWDPRKALVALEKENCTVLQGFPCFFRDMMQHKNFEKSNLDGVKKILMCCTPSEKPPSPEFVREVKEKFGVEKLVVTVSTQTTAGLLAYEDKYEEKGGFTRIPPFVELRVTSMQDSHKILPRGEEGRLQVAGWIIDYRDQVGQVKDMLAQIENTGSPHGKWIRTAHRAKILRNGVIEFDLEELPSDELERRDLNVNRRIEEWTERDNAKRNKHMYEFTDKKLAWDKEKKELEDEILAKHGMKRKEQKKKDDTESDESDN